MIRLSTQRDITVGCQCIHPHYKDEWTSESSWSDESSLTILLTNELKHVWSVPREQCRTLSLAPFSEETLSPCTLMSKSHCKSIQSCHEWSPFSYNGNLTLMGVVTSTMLIPQSTDESVNIFTSMSMFVCGNGSLWVFATTGDNHTFSSHIRSWFLNVTQLLPLICRVTVTVQGLIKQEHWRKILKTHS